MNEALKAVGVQTELVPMEGAGHGWPINSPFGQQALAKVVPFFDKLLKSN
jgi:acetyl esterase/lipase